MHWTFSVSATWPIVLPLLVVAPTGAPSEPGALASRSIPVPSNVLSLAGEVMAFEAVGEGGEGTLTVDLSELRDRFGMFDVGVVFETSPRGGTRAFRVEVGPGGAATWDAVAGHRYLVRASLGEIAENTYDTLCFFHRPEGEAVFVPEICTKILCSAEPFAVGELMEQYPALAEHAGALGPDDGLIGGFGGFGGNVCEWCFDSTGPWIASEGCSDDGDPGYGNPPDPSPACEFAGWASYAPSACPTPKSQATRNWSEWTSFYEFAAGDDIAALSINLATTDLPCAGFGALLDVVAVYDTCWIEPRMLRVRATPPGQSPGNFVQFKSTISTTGPAPSHTLSVRWSLPYSCSDCPDGIPVPLVGNVRDSRTMALLPIQTCFP